MIISLNSSGVPPVGSSPGPLKRSATSGIFRIATMSLLTRFTSAFDVPMGANTPLTTPAEMANRWRTSIQLDARLLDHIRPFLGLFPDISGKCLG